MRERPKARKWTPFQWRLQCEREGMALDTPQPEETYEAPPIASFLGEALAGLRLGDGLAVAQLRGEWEELAGEVMARHSAPGGLRGGALTVNVRHPGLAAEMRGAPTAALLKAIQAKHPEMKIRMVRWQVGRLG